MTPGSLGRRKHVTRGKTQGNELDMDAGPAFRCAKRPEFIEGARVRRTKRRDIDWNAIERDYRASVLSLRALAAKHGCSHSTIANFAGRHGWIRAHAGSVARRPPQ